MRKNPGNPKLDEANKCIFVKDYEAAEKILETLVNSKVHEGDLLLHLRRIELATKLEKLESLRDVYEAQTLKDPGNLHAQLALLFTEQHGEFIEQKDALERYQTLLRINGPHAGIYYGIGFCMEIEHNYERSKGAYEQCLTLDPNWYPAYFGLSQVYYQLHDEKKGDHYFFLFEELAPYNVYGNFETHRKLSNEFVDRQNFTAAEVAIQTLGEWWHENKGFTPEEIQLFEKFATARIADAEGDRITADIRRNQGKVIARQIIEKEKQTEGVLYFAAKVLEEFTEFPLALETYKRILREESTNPEMVQKIGGQFLALGEVALAHELFLEAYKTNPDQPEIRFCLVVVKLRMAKVNVEEYLIGKERLKKLMDGSGDKVEILSLLHSLAAKFGEDPDVHCHMAETYVRLANKEKAAKHFEKMYALDSYSRISTLKYASFLMQYGDAEQAKALLQKADEPKKLSSEEICELNWLYANYEFRKMRFRESIERLNRILDRDPWNLSYILLLVRCLSELARVKVDFETVDITLARLTAGEEEELDWKEYDTRTKALKDARCVELVYAREKLRFLYADGEDQTLTQLVQAASVYNAQRGIFDLLKLLNTNFDSPDIYLALGTLFRDLWQLETASMWFDQMLSLPTISEQQRARACLEQADCYIWRGVQLEKAVEYAKLALDLGDHKDKRPIRVMAHGLLRLGKARQAEVYLEDNDSSDDPETIYLKGLVKYRNGAQQEANAIWKPLLTVRTENLRFHNIKQEVMRYYYNREPYRGMN